MMLQQILQRAAAEIVPAAMASAFAAYSSLRRCMQPYLCADCGKAHHMSSSEDVGLDQSSRQHYQCCTFVSQTWEAYLRVCEIGPCTSASVELPHQNAKGICISCLYHTEEHIGSGGLLSS